MNCSEAAEVMAGFGADTDSLADVIKKLTDMLEEIEEFFVQGPPWFRRKQSRERAQSIEQAYQTEIKWATKERPFQKIHKPP